MLVIRLTRTGKTSQESFRMVVAEGSKAVKRQYVELVGHYAPTTNPKVLKFDKDRILYWISKGAQPSESVASLLKAEGVPGMEKYIKFKTDRKFGKKKDKGKETAPVAPAAAPKAEPKVEPKEEPKDEPKQEDPAAPEAPATPDAPAAS